MLDKASVASLLKLAQGNRQTYTIRDAAAPNGSWMPVQSGIPSFGGDISRTVPFTGSRLFFEITTP
jgi:hypothetical protein